uniref:Alpha-1,3-mannosyl-glycoprotein 2-beta-N-acetylglucosaminyltransferase n=1 Tax=Parastrongyloides trichosuri TaxID=131310 RepID=A0A0N4ZRH0_PARTI
MLNKYKIIFQKLISSKINGNQNITNNTIIPIVVLVCNRVDALKHLITKLLKLRPDLTTFPIYISQDCDNEVIWTFIRNHFMNNVTYIKHKSPLKKKIQVPLNFVKYKNYYYISRHYKLILSHMFDYLNYKTVVLLEDDLDISIDFFSYFKATYHQLLKKDKSLYCISAWNDNGFEELIDQQNPMTLYRTDFFPGLGWMLTNDLWKELSPKWPKGFWDDWIRKPEYRKNRTCIRPEISRTSMTNFGKTGASNGYLYDNFLSRIKLNSIPVNFDNIDLSYLSEKKYEKYYMRIVYDYSQKVSFFNLRKIIQKPVKKKNNFLRIEYITLEEFEKIAHYLSIMNDFKEGIPRTAYKGIITIFKNGWRIFVAPNRKKWNGYNNKWEFDPTV